MGIQRSSRCGGNVGAGAGWKVGANEDSDERLSFGDAFDNFKVFGRFGSFIQWASRNKTSQGVCLF